MKNMLKPYIEIGAPVILAVLLALSTFIFILSLAPVGFGIWPQSETPSNGFRIIAGLCGVFLTLWAAVSPRVQLQLTHPFVLVPLLLALWSVFCGLFQAVPLHSLYGSPEVGEGGMWFLSIALVTGAAMAIANGGKKTALLKGGIATFMIISGIVLFIMTWIYKKVSPEAYVPYFFSEYLSFIAGFIAIAAIGLSTGLRFGRLLIIAAFIVAIGLVYIAANRTAIGLALAAPVIWFIARKLPLSPLALRRLALAGGIIFPLLLTLFIFLPDEPSFATQGTFWGSMANSMVSRARLLSLALTSFANQPSAILHGFGWGTYSDLLAINLPVDWVHLRDDKTAMEVGAGAHWDAVHRVDFHSHNFVIESIIGGGIVALILLLFFIAMIILWSRKNQQYTAMAASAYVGGSYAFWFMLPVCPPFLAIAWGSLANRAALFPGRRFFRRWIVLTIGLTSAFTLFMGIEGWRFSPYAHGFISPLPASAFSTDWRKACPDSFQDSGRGGAHLAFRLRVIEQSVLADIGKGMEPSDAKLDYLRGMICASEDYIDKGSVFRLRVSSLLARSDMAFTISHPKVQPIIDIYLANWDKRLDEALRMAPKRTDLAAGYLLWLLKEGREAEFLRWSSKIYEMDRQSPVGLWFSGIALSANPARAQEGVARMRKGLREGIERIIPVDDELKQQLGQ
jgi:hypothetical protein